MVEPAGTTIRAPPEACPQGSARVQILGVGVDDVTLEEVLERIRAQLRQPGLSHVVTVNPEYVMQARSSPQFAHVLARAQLALPDGMGIVWASRLLGRPLRERVAGSDLVPHLAALAAREGVPLFLLGAAPGVAAEAARRLRALHPSLRLGGTHPGSPHPAQDEPQAALIRQSGAGLLLVAFGSPAQDLWIHRNRDRLGVQVAMGVGGALDFLAGRTARAPARLRRLGLEWLHRLVRQPWRWRRVLRVLAFGLLVLLSRMRPR